MDKVTELFKKMDHHQELVEHFDKLGDDRQAVHHRLWVGICDLQLQTLFFGKAKVSNRK